MRTADRTLAASLSEGRRGLAVACFAIAFASSCGGGNELVSCTIVQAQGAAGLVGLCEEVAPSMSDELRMRCAAADGGASGGPTVTYAAQPCSHVGAIGGCRFTEGTITATDWTYSNGTPPGMSAGSVRARCAGLNPPGTFVSP
jgi:hypothetical protein